MSNRLVSLAVVVALALGMTACKKRAAPRSVLNATRDAAGYVAEQPPPLPSQEQLPNQVPSAAREEQPTNAAPAALSKEQRTSPAPLALPEEQPQSAVAPVPLEERPAGTEVLTRGPVHEAFAEPINLQAQADFVAPNQPPPDIEELPPSEKPKGENFVWVPGYWSWDADQTTYIWVTGCWRVAPPNMYWVPGYWAQATGAWQWVGGYWAPAGSEEIEYLPPPPQSYDVEPPAPAPSPDSFWVPPCEYWCQGEYVRRPGYWLTAQPGWVWVPSHYVRTPRGHIFVGGHWDYSLERRGVLFAPVYFPRAVYVRPGFIYSPTIVLDIRIVTVNLFAYPRYCHYYFGDYYDEAYLRLGIYPWFESVRIHTWYDPIYVYDRWHRHRTDPRWEEHERHQYDLRRANKDLRPPRTYTEMEARLARLPKSQREDLQLAQPLSAVVAAKASPLKFERINTGARETIAKKAADVHKAREERSRSESMVGQKTVRPSTERTRLATPPREGREQATPRRERREAVTPPTEAREPAPPSRERREAVTPPTEAREPAPPSRERREAVTPPTEAREPATPPRERRDVVTPATERREPATPRRERREAVTPPTEAREPATPPRERREAVTAPIERSEPATPRRERREAATPPTEGREEPATPPRERREPATPPTSRRAPAAAPQEPAGPGTPPANTEAPGQTPRPPTGQTAD